MDDGRVDSQIEDLAASLHLSMLTNGWQWRYPDGALRVPEPEDIAEGIGKMISRLAEEPVGTGIQAGRIYISKSEEGTHDVFIYTGTVSD